MTIGEKIEKLRKENNLTQEGFADLLNVSRQSVSKWELNTVYPETEKLIRISKLFNCSIDYLLKDEVETMDITVDSAKEEYMKNKHLSYMLTYLSFPPVFGFIVAIFSLRLQFKVIKSKTQIALSILGAIISISFTVGIILGIVFNL